MNTELSLEIKDRTLWFDGDTTIKNMEFFYSKILDGEDISSFCVDEITQEIKEYNRHAETPLKIKEDLTPFDLSWNIPESYKIFPVRKYLLKLLEKEISSNRFLDSEIEERITRTEYELKLWDELGMMELLRAMIYMIDVFKANNIVWGTGRGSSCSSYVLYLIGLHSVDSILYNLDVKSDFFKE
jgi:DNA polymerase III alpha subunit